MRNVYSNDNVLFQGVEPKRMFGQIGKSRLKKHCMTQEEIDAYIVAPRNHDRLRKRDTATVFLFSLGGEVFANIVHPLPDDPTKLHHHVRELNDTDASHAHRHHMLITPIKPTAF